MDAECYFDTPSLPAYLEELSQQSEVLVRHDVTGYRGEAPPSIPKVVVRAGAVDGTGTRRRAVGLRVEVIIQTVQNGCIAGDDYGITMRRHNTKTHKPAITMIQTIRNKIQ